MVNTFVPSAKEKSSTPQNPGMHVQLGLKGLLIMREVHLTLCFGGILRVYMESIGKMDQFILWLHTISRECMREYHRFLGGCKTTFLLKWSLFRGHLF